MKDLLIIWVLAVLVGVGELAWFNSQLQKTAIDYEGVNYFAEYEPEVWSGGSLQSGEPDLQPTVDYRVLESGAL